MFGCSGRFPRPTLGIARLVLVAAVVLLPAVALAQTGTVTGTVRAAATGLPIAGAEVYVYTNLIEIGGSALTNASGFFSIAAVPVGAYFAVVFPPPSSGVMAEVFPNVQCHGGCQQQQLLGGTPFAVTSGGTTANRNFSLDVGGTVTGTITNATTGLPIQNVGVTLFVRFGSQLAGAGFASTNASGVYSATDLPAGTYYAFTNNSLGFVNEVYDNIRCVGSCPTSQLLEGTPIPVTAGATSAGRNFQLETGGRLTGTVTNAATGAPLQNVFVGLVTVFQGSTVSAGGANTDATGTYTVQGLASGTYYAFTSNTTGFTNEVYDNVLCPLTCPSSLAAQSGAGVPVTLGTTTGNVNFALEAGGSISGTVTNQNTAAPLANVQVTVAVRVGANNFTTSATTNAAGVYTVQGLPTGSYQAFTGNSQGFINEIYDNLQCLGSCTTANAVATGASIPVTQGSTTTGRNFALQPGGSITGTITDSATGVGIVGASVQMFTVVGGGLTSVSSASTNATGVYTASGLMAGTYFLATSASARGYRNEVYDNIPCIGTSCSTAVIQTGAPTAVVLGGVAAGRNFALGRTDFVQGTITDAATGAPLAGAQVTFLHSPSGTVAATAFTGLSGTYLAPTLANGNYVAFTSNSSGYFNEIFSNIRCATTCSSATALAAGAIIPITAAGADEGGGTPMFVAGINFGLDVRNEPPGAPSTFRAITSGGTVQFSWIAPTPSTTGVAASYIVEAGLAPGTTVVSLPASGTSLSVPGAPSGVFYARVRAVNAFGIGPPSNEVTLVIGAGGTAPPEAPTNAAAFVSGGRLTFTWAAALSGGPSTSFLVEAGSATGLANIATLAVAGRSFTFIPVPNGFYFLRVRAVNVAGVSPPSGEVMIVAGGVASPPGAPNFTSHSVSGSTVTLNWLPPTFGAATSYFIEAGSATGLANLASVNTGNTNLTISFSGVPPGTYFVRLRAVNGLGASVVSNERTITVP